MKEILNIVQNMQMNLIVWLVLSMCTVIGLPLAVYFYIKGKIKKQISYSIISNTIVQNASSNIPNMTILYKDKNVENLVISRLALWNSGNTTINKEDVVNCDPISICFEKGVLLDTSIMVQNNESNPFTVKKIYDINESFIYFDYLDRNDGVVIEIIHSSENCNDVFVAGKIKGSKDLKKIIIADKNSLIWKTGKIVYFINHFTPFGIVICTILLDIIFTFTNQAKQSIPMNQMFPISFIIVFNIICAFIIVGGFYGLFKSKIPSELRKSLSFLK